jgi:hypothetical protein
MAEKGRYLTLRNAKIDMYKGSMRLAVNTWGKCEICADHQDFELKVRAGSFLVMSMGATLLHARALE